ncbi:hypothetical protein [Comamonas endophytica]|nr:MULTISPECIES: hypothetical protein [unclassified Acidovorax]MCD2514625.1 hypothetical protein [Acidovorax sp. D4N7]
MGSALMCLAQCQYQIGLGWSFAIVPARHDHDVGLRHGFQPAIGLH